LGGLKNIPELGYSPANHPQIFVQEKATTHVAMITRKIKLDKRRRKADGTYPIVCSMVGKKRFSFFIINLSTIKIIFIHK
jgi:hypothetical protein